MGYYDKMGAERYDKVVSAFELYKNGEMTAKHFTSRVNDIINGK